MGDGRTELFRNMWTRTTTNDKVLEKGMVDTTPFSEKTADQYPIGATLEEQAKHTDWEYSDTHVRTQEETEYPDAKMHQIVSFVKSGVRIAGCLVGVMSSVPLGFVLLLVAEIVGIVEELV